MNTTPCPPQAASRKPASSRSFVPAFSGIALVALLGLSGCATGPPTQWIACSDSSCPICRGYGTTRCDACFGRGKIPCTRCRNGVAKCYACSQTGFIGGARCITCQGKGEFRCPDCFGATVKNCTTCGGDGMKNCPRGRYQVIGQAPPAPAAVPSQPVSTTGGGATAKKYCTACGTSMAGGASFCPDCGKKQ